MKKTCQNIILFFAVLLLFACNDEFLNESLDVSDVGASMIIISPTWTAGDYMFSINGAGSADFEIVSKPHWLKVDSNTGTFINGMAIIHCEADVEPRFSELGIYADQMLVSVNDKKYAVPLYYITEGDPSVEVIKTLEVNYSGETKLKISNKGDGILVWDIVDMPEWLEVNLDGFVPMSVFLGRDADAYVPFTVNVEKAINSGLSGTIVLQTNDRNNLMIQVPVSVSLGSPRLSVGAYDSSVNFGRSGTSYYFNFTNGGSGLLVWHFENLPDWLSVSQQSGIYESNNYQGGVVFTCDRSKLNPGVNTATIYLESNDARTSSFAIDVTAQGAVN
ncbi:hypothetical protein SAMN05444274_10591 [Mariniphaga anaerophila]|uniref:BACON domain-containing protein n=1 Tax=Mariniphaga anaerophila TaxID=1484053 RepID=A0A1M5BCN2_9BACT|nr:hypothetical protein [Mariniphaga anaerophila]SHF40303.1 hypothetical protein SAMN05444274_10591 [Mariniphaga anaerophila]